MCHPVITSAVQQHEWTGRDGSLYWGQLHSDAQLAWAMSQWELHFVRRVPTFVGPQYATCVMSPFCQAIPRFLKKKKKFLHPYSSVTVSQCVCEGEGERIMPWD
jgi:hypothetical protein